MNRIVHFDIHASEPEKLADFYRNVFGWEIKKWDSEEMEYWMVMTGDKNEPGIDGGIMRRKGAKGEIGAPVTSFVSTVVVEDIDGTSKKILENGGTEALPKFNIAGMAWQAYFHDPDNNLFGVHQVIKKEEGK